ncbi:hypothetical protein OSB04_005887 [Centaurea solstitialis]|uniref:non-specific serine/threonine protein kinase n=1 Tax=Centaurea solstitialis TaxID=347529 RepID=A0AA38U012_9ASTR|nr:hypothetical protein OSB04_005887 [Centaurea solstitialis]
MVSMLLFIRTVEDNLMSGRIPEELGNMSSIERLFLNGNYFTGELPPSFANLINLTDLRISDLRGPDAPFPSFTQSFKYLILRSCNLIGELPENISSLAPADPNLLQWTRSGRNDFSFNKLNGSIPEGFEGLLRADFISQYNCKVILPLVATEFFPVINKLSYWKLAIWKCAFPDTRECKLYVILQSIAPYNPPDFTIQHLRGWSLPLLDLRETCLLPIQRITRRKFLCHELFYPNKDLEIFVSVCHAFYFCTVVPVNRSHACRMFVKIVDEITIQSDFQALHLAIELVVHILVGFPSLSLLDVLMHRLPISTFGSDITSLYINCGGEQQSLEDGKKTYEADLAPGTASGFVSVENRWGFSNTGDFDDKISDSYIKRNRSRVLGSNPELYSNARASALSLTYYGFCMHKGSYNVSLHFAEIVFTDDETLRYAILGRRVFDIYIQGNLVEKDFDISHKAGGVGKPYVSTHSVNVTNTLEIRLYWAGKGTTNIPGKGNYGPLISAISVDPKDGSGKGNGVSRGALAGIVVAAVCIIILILGVLWWWGCLQCRDTMDIELSGVTCSFTLRQMKAATNNFDVANKIGEGGFGSVYKVIYYFSSTTEYLNKLSTIRETNIVFFMKGVLPDGTLIAVKQLSSKSRQGNREFLNELGMISALKHPHLVKLHGCCIEGNQLLLAYEYMENNSLARALFGPEEWQLELDWPTRYRICIGIARGLSFLHEESRLKIVHRDIKATNVLLDKDLNAKISDFGLAKLDEEDNTHISTRIAGTYGYMAPEYALRGYLTDKVDVYSYGIVLLEILSGTANTVDRTKENQFILLDRAVALKNEGNLMELVDPRLGTDYDVQEMMVVINLALLCTTISPTDRPAMSAVVSMLEGRIVPQEVAVEQSVSMPKVDHEKMMKQLAAMDKSEIKQVSIPYTDSSTSAPDLYPVDGFSEYLQKRDGDAKSS